MSTTEGLTQKYRQSVAESADRATLRSWTLRSLIVPGVWGSGLDQLLRDLRQIILEHGADGFPSIEIEKRMAARGKSLTISAEQVADILSLRYGSARTFAVLATLFPNVDTRNVHHIDHIYPRALLEKSRLKRQGTDVDTIEELQVLRDELPNLQLLEGPVNMSKSAAPPDVWADSAFHSPEHRQAYLDRNQIPWLPASTEDVASFVKARRDVLAHLISDTLAGPTTTHGLQPSASSAQPTSPSVMSIEEGLAETVSGG